MYIFPKTEYDWADAMLRTKPPAQTQVLFSSSLLLSSL